MGQKEVVPVGGRQVASLSRAAGGSWCTPLRAGGNSKALICGLLVPCTLPCTLPSHCLAPPPSHAAKSRQSLWLAGVRVLAISAWSGSSGLADTRPASNP